MYAAPNHSERNGAATLPLPTFKCVVIYEDFAAGKRGKRFYETLVAAMDGDCTPTHDLWSFPVLAIAEMRNIAASAAAAADIVILALSGRDELPAAVKEWVEMWAWLIEDTHPALLALFESPNGESGSIRGYLRSVTASKRLDFFPDSAAPASCAGSTRTTRETPFTREAWQDEELGACREPMTREA